MDDGQSPTVGISSPIMDEQQIPRVGFSSWTVPNLSITLVDQVHTTLPDGSSSPAQLGSLALGGAVNQTFTPDSGVAINASLIPGWFYEQGATRQTRTVSKFRSLFFPFGLMLQVVPHIAEAARFRDLSRIIETP